MQRCARSMLRRPPAKARFEFSRATSGFMGAPAMNLIPAKAKKNGNGTRIEIACENDAPLVLHDSNSPDLPRNVIMGLRPEDIAEAGFRSGAHVQTAEGLVDVVEPAGPISGPLGA